jgi:ATP-dependent Zn protease
MRAPRAISIKRPKSIDPRRPTAHHEAGHAVLSAAINDRPEHVSIRGQDGTLGRSAQRMSFVRPTSLAQVYLAGFAAEHLLTGRRPRGFDIELGLGVLVHLDRDLVEKIEGIDGTDGYGAVREVLRTGVREIESEIRAEVERVYEVARESLRAVWPSVRAVAEALLEREELDRAGLDDVLADTDIYAPVFAVQKAHGLLAATRASVAVPGGPPGYPSTRS